jgi:diaminopimelate decarboxylase
MDYFHEKRGSLLCEETPLAAVARGAGTPCFVYSRRTLELHYDRLVAAFSGVDLLPCFSVKANSNLAVLDLLRRRGSGFDVVSAGELHRVLRIGADPRRVVFAGVGKTAEEMAAGLDAGILAFNVESPGELDLLERVARRRRRRADVALRVNPDVDPRTHTYISTGKRESKFGIDVEAAGALAAGLPRRKWLRMTGVHAHIGSQITEVGPHTEAVRKVVAFARSARGAGNPVSLLNMGGGFGVYYRGGEARPADEFGEAIVPLVEAEGLRLLLEPGRFIMGNAGVLVTKVLFVKESGDRRFVVVDAAMNDLVRPALYGAHHRVWPVRAPFPEAEAEKRPAAETVVCDVVGPICETGDFLAKDRRLPPVEEGDLLCIFTAGAYGRVMSSNYNSRPRAPEVMVDGARWQVVRDRETVEDLVRGERVLRAARGGARGGTRSRARARR